MSTRPIQYRARARLKHFMKGAPEKHVDDFLQKMHALTESYERLHRIMHLEIAEKGIRNVTLRALADRVRASMKAHHSRRLKMVGVEANSERSRIFRIIDGAMIDMVKQHPDYLTSKGYRAARMSAVKRILGGLLGYVKETRKSLARTGSGKRVKGKLETGAVPVVVIHGPAADEVGTTSPSPTSANG